MKKISFNNKWDTPIIVFTNIFLILFAIWIVIIPITMSKRYYMNQFEKYDTPSYTGYTMEELGDIAQRIIDYLKDDVKTLQIKVDGENVFSYQALKHMNDVKRLYVEGNKIGWFVFIFLILDLIYIGFYYKRMGKKLLKVSAITIGVVLSLVTILLIACLINFDKTFEFLHHLLFWDINKFNDAFFSYRSNYEIDRISGIDNVMLVRILTENVFYNAMIWIGSILVALEAIWFTFVLVVYKNRKKEIE